MNQKSVIIREANGLVMKFFTLSNAALIVLLALLYNSGLINMQTILLILASTCLVCTVYLFYLFYGNKTCIISISDDSLKFPLNEEGKPVEVSLSISEIAYFETRFNKIILHDIHNNTFSIMLDHIKSERKRWEIKELLKQHIKLQNKLAKAV